MSENESESKNDQTPVEETKADESSVQESSQDAFLEKYQDEIQVICNRVSNTLDDIGITAEQERITIVQCVNIVGEIGKSITSLKGLTKQLVSAEPEEKASLLFLITISVLNSSVVSERLSAGVREQLEEFAENGQALSVITDLVNWVSEELLESLDANDDGAVTVEEIEAGCTKCCKCLPGSKLLGRIWGKIFVKLCCCACSANKIIYDEKKYREGKK